jgi:hypothetical protein
LQALNDEWIFWKCLLLWKFPYSLLESTYVPAKDI